MPFAHAPHVVVPTLVPLIGLLVLAAALVVVLVALRRRRAGAGVPDLAELPDLPAPPAPPTPPTAPVAPALVPGPPSSYADLARQLAELGDLEAAAASQWAADLEVLAPHLAGDRDELAALVGDLSGDDPLALLQRAREAASSLVGTATPVPVLTPLDSLAALAPESGRPRGRHVAVEPPTHGGLPPELRALMSERQRAAYDGRSAERQERSA